MESIEASTSKRISIRIASSSIFTWSW